MPLEPDGSSLQNKTLITRRRDRIALFAITRQSATITEKHTLLAGNVRAHEPRIGFQEQGVGDHLQTMVAPALFCFNRRADTLKIVLPHVADTIRHPLDVLFPTARHIAEIRRVVCTDHRKEVGESSHLQPEVGARAILPLVLVRCRTIPGLGSRLWKR